MWRRRSVSLRRTNGPCRCRAALPVTASCTTCRSTARCSATAGPWIEALHRHGTLGVSVRHRNFVAFLGRTCFSKTFETEREDVQFGTFSLSWYY